MGLLRFGSWPILFQVVLGPTLLLVALFLTIVAAASTVTRLQHTSDMVLTSRAVLDSSAHARTLVLEMETGVRGFALTADDVFLEPYLEAQPALDQQLAELREMVSDSPVQQARLDQVGHLASEWDRMFAGEVIQQTRVDGEALELMRSGEGRQRTDAIRAVMNEFEVAEHQALVARMQEDQEARGQATRLFFLALAMAVGAALLAYATGQGIARPVRSFAAAIRRVAEGDLSERLPVEGANELARAAQALNSMAQSLAEARERLTAQNVRFVEEAAQAKRARSETKAVLDSARSAMALFTPDHRLQMTNQRFGDLFGLDASTIVGSGLDDLKPQLERAFSEPGTFFGLFTRAAADPDQEFRENLRQDWPERRELELFSAPVRTSDGGHLGRLFAFRDVTPERELERLKDELMAVVSHELRTPLASLVGFAELLIARDYDEQQRKAYLGVMLDEGKRLTALINDFLDLQRLERGAQKVHPWSLDLRPLLEAAVAGLGEDALRPIVLELPSDLPSVLADADRTTQVAVNLLSNARKYSPEGGAVRVSARQDGGVVEVAVQDQGLGLPAEALPRLFEPFFRIDNTDRREIKGTGLGLAIVRRLVEAQGGQVWAESEGRGAGSTFRFTLPLAPTPTIAVGQPGRVAQQARPGQDVLVVEDHAAYRTWLVETLSGEGYPSRAVATAEAALEQIDAAQPGVVLLDLRLGGQLDGWDLLTRLREQPETRELPVVVVTSFDEQERGLALGVEDYLVKPVSKERLIAALGRIAAVRQGTALVIEDDRAIRTLAVQVVEAGGMRARGVGSGEEALALLEAEPERYALLIVDLGLPGMDGFAVLEALGAHSMLRDLPVVIFTARDLTVDEKQYLAARAQEVVRKGNGVPLAEAVARALGRRQRTPLP